jgi:RNA binding exosome subunit
MNSLNVSELFRTIYGNDIRVIDAVIEAQNYALYTMSTLKQNLENNTADFKPYQFTHSMFISNF